MEPGYGTITDEKGTPVTTGRSRQEGKLTSAIEKRTAAFPSLVYLGLAGASIVGSLALFIAARRESAIFVGTWAPTFLILGLYNKLVKQAETVTSPVRGAAAPD